MKKTAVVCLNGPPRSGKDELAKMLGDALTFESMVVGQMKMTNPIETFLKNCLGLKSIDDYYLWREEKKDEVYDVLPNPNNLTFRQIMISFSEDFMKELFGPQVFGQLAATQIESRLTNLYDVVIISDTGFQEEYNKIKDEIDDTTQIFLCRIHREGTNFDNDSREYVVDDTIIDVYNDGTLKDLKQQAKNLSKHIHDTIYE